MKTQMMHGNCFWLNLMLQYLLQTQVFKMLVSTRFVALFGFLNRKVSIHWIYNMFPVLGTISFLLTASVDNVFLGHVNSNVNVKHQLCINRTKNARPKVIEYLYSFLAVYIQCPLLQPFRFGRENLTIWECYL